MTDRPGRFGLAPDPGLTHLALALQADLLGAVAGSAPTGPWQVGVPGAKFAPMVHDLPTALLSPTWPGLTLRRDGDAIAATRDHAFAALDPPSGFEALGIIASILAGVARGCPADRHGARRDGRGSACAAMDLTWFIRRLLPAEQQRLRAAALDWGPVLGHAVAGAVDAVSTRCRQAIAVRDQARHDAAWARPAAKWRFAVAAAQRVAARRRAAASRLGPGQGVVPPTARIRRQAGARLGGEAG